MNTTDGLVDAQAMALANPDTFTVPSEMDLASLKTGDYVKVCRNSERFWVEIVTAEPRLIYGIVTNRLIDPDNEDLIQGAPLTCERRHIYSVMKNR